MSRQSEALESLQVSCTKENFIWSVINRLAAESILSKFENTFRHICDLQCLSFRAFSAQGPMHLTSYADVMIHRHRSQCFRFHNESNISCRLKRSELSSLVVDLSRFLIETLCSSWIYFDCTVLFDSESTEDGAEKNGTKIEKPCRWKLIRNEKNISEQTQSQRSSTRTQVSCLIRLSRDKSLKSFAKMWPWRNNYGVFTVFVTSKSKLMMTANTELLCIICCSSVGVGDPFCTRTSYYQWKVQIRKRNLTNYLIAFWHTTFNPVRYPDIRNKPIYSQFSFSLCTKALESIKIPGNW